MSGRELTYCFPLMPGPLLAFAIISVNGTTIYPVLHAKDLGVIFYSTLYLTLHIQSIARMSVLPCYFPVFLILILIPSLVAFAYTVPLSEMQFLLINWVIL